MTGLRLIEPIPIEDDLVSGLGAIEDIGHEHIRFVLYAKQTLYETGEGICVIKRKIVLPLDAVFEAGQITREWLGAAQRKPLLRLVS